MKKLGIVAAALAATLFLAAGSALAASDSKGLTIGATVGGLAKLTLGQAGINFPSADPDVTASIPANENAVNVSAKIRAAAAGVSTLEVLASDDLKDGTKVIGIDNVTWTATGADYAAGTMSKAAAQTAGSFTGPGQFDGTFSYFLANDWAYEPGSYTASVTYTLTSP
jgi:hypothetical protein